MPFPADSQFINVWLIYFRKEDSGHYVFTLRKTALIVVFVDKSFGK